MFFQYQLDYRKKQNVVFEEWIEKDWVRDAQTQRIGGTTDPDEAIAIFADRIGGPTAVGTVLTARVLPGFVVGPLAGVLADRFPKRRGKLVAGQSRRQIYLPSSANIMKLRSRALAMR